jgi:uncharacterized membrane protein (DUF2068 family)
MTSQTPAGLRMVIAYKLGKALLQIPAGLLLAYGARHGLEATLGALAEALRRHAVHAWSERAAAALIHAAGSPRELRLMAAALGVDGVVSFLEGWVLLRGYRWGPWVVVGATGVFIPYELLSLPHHLHAGRIVLLAINCAVVVYLARRARHHASTAAQAPARRRA